MSTGTSSWAGPVTWHVSSHAARLATVAAVALAVPVLTGQPLLFAVAAPVLVLLSTGTRGDAPATASVRLTVSAQRCVEGELVEVSAHVSFERPVDAVTVRLESGSSTQVETPVDVTHLTTGAVDVRWTVRMKRWGRGDSGAVVVRATTAGRLLSATVRCPPVPVEVFPHAPDADAPLVPARLLERVGEHVSRLRGEGTEFADIRPYAPGERLRRVHWAATSRRGRLHVTSFAAERATDVVIAIDAYSDVGPSRDGTLDRSLHGAVGLAQAYLRAADRVGVVVLGGSARWLPPGGGTRQWYAVAETLLDSAREAGAVRELRLPRAAVPPGALVIVLSPLLEEPTVSVLASLRERGHALVVVDVLAEEPDAMSTASVAGSPAARLWRLDRSSLVYRLGERGIPVVARDGEGPVSAPLRPLSRRPLLSSRP